MEFAIDIVDMIPVDAIHIFLKVSYICIAMSSFTNMHFWFGRLDIISDGEHRIMARLCKKNHSTLDVQNLECLCKCYLKE